MSNRILGQDLTHRTAGAHTGGGMDDHVMAALEQRLGRLHARQRLGMERDHEDRMAAPGLELLHMENWYAVPAVIRRVLQATGLYWRAKANTGRLRVRRNALRLPTLPGAFDGFTILHLTDLHTDISPLAMTRLAELLPALNYDLCVITGDFRGRTYGPFQATLAELQPIRERLRSPVYAVLGNHDSLRMVPGLETMGIRVLLNETVAIERGSERVHLAGVDDAHHYRLDDIAGTAAEVPPDAFSILLSHTPEVYRQARHAGFDVMLSGHTHGGQLCLPGGLPVTLDAVLPRRLGAGPWRYGPMLGYTSTGAGTSILAVRLNCPPEIVLHRLERE